MPDAAELAAMDMQHVAQLLRSQSAQIEALRAQIEWFKRQIFGQKSERYAAQPDAQQMHLGELMPAVPVPVPVPAPEAEAEHDVPAHKRRKPKTDFADDRASVPFFDEARVPVVSIEVPNPEVRGLSAEEVAAQYEIVGEKHSHRLAQRPGAYVVLKYVRTTIKRRTPLDGVQTLHCPPAPAGVIEGSRADVSFIAGVMVDKFQWHLPLASTSGSPRPASR
jgi:hypothetical protein